MENTNYQDLGEEREVGVEAAVCKDGGVNFFKIMINNGEFKRNNF